MNTAGEICCREVVYALCDTTVQGAMQLMRQYLVDALIVVATEEDLEQRQRPLGIVTNSDVISGVYAIDLDPSVITLGDIVADLGKLSEDDDLVEAVQAIRSQGLHHLMVVNQGGDLIGTISTADLIGAMAQELNGLTQNVARTWTYGPSTLSSS